MLKQWLTGLTGGARQVVFMSGWSRKHQRRLRALKGPLLYISPKKPKLLFPGVSQFLGLPQWEALPESIEPPHTLYATARQLINAQVETIRQTVPDFFQNTALPPALRIDYETPYKMNRQQTLAMTGLAFLGACFETPYFAASQTETSNAHRGSRLPIILDSPVSPALLGENGLAHYGLPSFTAIFSKVKPWQPANFRKNRSPLQVPDFDKPTILLVMTAPVHYDLARAALDSLAKDYSIVIYFANPAKISPTLYQELAQRHFVINAHQLLPDESLIESACQYFNQKMEQIQALSAPPSLKEALFAELNRVGDTVQIMMLLETVLAHLRPVAVLGCLEKNRLGIAFKTLQSRYGYRLLNFQHGMMPRTHNLDWMHFDRFFIWSPLSRNVILQDGYLDPDSLAMVGNPSWDNVSDQQTQSLSDKARQIREWQGESALIGAYTQYSGDYLTLEVRRNYLKSLFAYLEARPTVKLLIKKHPLETDSLAEEVLAASQLQDRVMICAGHSLDLWESFTLIDLSTTICSTTLLDSLRVGVPPIALDFTNIIGEIGYGYEQEPKITIINDPEAVQITLDTMLNHAPQQAVEQAAAVDTSQPHAESLVYPELTGTYQERVRQVLAELGLLKSQSDNRVGVPSA